MYRLIIISTQVQTYVSIFLIDKKLNGTKLEIMKKDKKLILVE